MVIKNWEQLNKLYSVPNTANFNFVCHFTVVSTVKIITKLMIQAQTSDIIYLGRNAAKN